MEWIKDKFYDKNDLLVALVILAIAGLIIWFRVDVIMGYTGDPASAQQDQNPNGGTPNVAAVDPDTLGEGDDLQDPLDPATDPNTEGDNPANSNGSQDGGTTSEGQDTQSEMPSSFTITVPPGASGEAIADILVNAGAISKKEIFINAVTTLQAETKLKAGTFTIPAGSTTKELVEIICGQSL